MRQKKMEEENQRLLLDVHRRLCIPVGCSMWMTDPEDLRRETHMTVASHTVHDHPSQGVYLHLCRVSGSTPKVVGTHLLRIVFHHHVNRTAQMMRQHHALLLLVRQAIALQLQRWLLLLDRQLLRYQSQHMQEHPLLHHLDLVLLDRLEVTSALRVVVEVSVATLEAAEGTLERAEETLVVVEAALVVQLSVAEEAM